MAVGRCQMRIKWLPVILISIGAIALYAVFLVLILLTMIQ